MKQTKIYVTCLGKSVVIFLFCLVWIGFSAQPAISQYRNSISGFVFDPQRNPVAQVPVEVLNEVNQSLQRTRTDNSGRFFFGSLSAGRFSVRVMPYGTNFEEQSQEVEIVNFVRPGSATSENAQKDFYLRLRRDAKEANAVTGTLFVQEVPEKAEKSYTKALSDFENKRDDAGIQELLNALEIFPDYFLVLERLGREYIKQQKYDFAQTVFTKAVTVNPRSFSGWYGLSFASYALKQSLTAIEAGQNAAKLEPTSINAVLILGISLRQAKRYDDAEKSLLLAKKLAKGQVPDVHWNLALLYNHNLKRYKDAADELELYLKVQPDDAKADNIKKLIAELRVKSASN